MAKSKRLPQGVFRRGSMLWIRYQNEKGKIVKETTGQRSVKVAEQIYNKRKTEVAMAVNFPSRKFNRVSFKELFDDWWENHAKHKPSKFEYLIHRIEKLFKLKARHITSDLVREFLSDLKEEGLSASSLNHYRTILNSIFNYAIRNKKYDENPVSAVPTFPEPSGRDRFTTPEEILKILKKCDEEHDTELKVFVILAATTGLRKGSILPANIRSYFLTKRIHISTSARRRTATRSRFRWRNWLLKLLKAYRATARTNTCFQQSRTCGLRVISKSLTPGI